MVLIRRTAILLLALLPAGCLTSPSDSSWDAWLDENHHPIRSSSARDTDFSDLAFLKGVIGSRRIVQLGESGHGVAEFTGTKVRLVQFLHQEMGFDVIAFESGLWECFRANEDMEGLSATDAMRTSIFSMWQAGEMVPLFESIKASRTTARPLALAGFDVEPTSNAVRSFGDRAPQLRQVIGVFDPALAEAAFAVDSAWATVPSRTVYARAEGDRLAPFYRQLSAEVTAHAADIARAFPHRPGLAAALAASLSGTTAYIGKHQAGTDTYEGYWAGISLRDRGMADNLTVILEQLFPGKKVIVWAHNFHVQRDAAGMGPGPGIRAHLKTMGSWVHERHGPDVYSVGLFMHHGAAAWNDRRIYTVTPAEPGSIEELFGTLSTPIAFVRLTGVPYSLGASWMYQTMAAKEWGVTPVTFVPRDQFDALLFFQLVHPPSYL